MRAGSSRLHNIYDNKKILLQLIIQNFILMSVLHHNPKEVGQVYLRKELTFCRRSLDTAFYTNNLVFGLVSFFYIRDA